MVAIEMLFTDEKLHNTGIGFKASMHVEPPSKKVTLVPGLTIDIDTSSYRDNVAFKDEIAPNDLGLYTVTQDPNDRWKFRTAGLRNVEITGPYMHNGSLQTLKEVVEFYNKGGIKTSGKMKNDNISPLMFPLNLSENEVDNVVEFLKTLTGSNVNELILDAKAAPIGEISLEDPNWFHENKPKY
jgi:cytochrome c peroxidase